MNRGLTTVLLCAGTLAMAPAAKADVLSISAAAFIKQCPCVSGSTPPEVNNGVLISLNQSNVYAAVDFPNNGQKVCSLAVVYEDINANDHLTARLLRKEVKIGGNPFKEPNVIAEVESAPRVPPTIRKSTTFAITSPTVNDTTGFYFVEVSIPTINLNLLGVQIDYRPICPVRPV